MCRFGGGAAALGRPCYLCGQGDHTHISCLAENFAKLDGGPVAYARAREEVRPEFEQLRLPPEEIWE